VFVLKHSHYKKNPVTYYQKYIYRSSCKIPVIVVRHEQNTNLLGIFSKKYSNTKFHESPSSGSTVVQCGQTLNPPQAHKNCLWQRSVCTFWIDSDEPCPPTGFRHWQPFQPQWWLWILDFRFVKPCNLLRIREVPSSSDTLTPTYKHNDKRAKIALS
jgi:hypothetical protein